MTLSEFISYTESERHRIVIEQGRLIRMVTISRAYTKRLYLLKGMLVATENTPLKVTRLFVVDPNNLDQIEMYMPDLKDLF